MLKDKSLETFSSYIIEWYKVNKRDLPWRNTQDPYKIWLSEIILQQTRVNQGLSYYNKFVSNFPTIKDLANASEEEVLKLWQGLGYYSRARNMHATANNIIENHKGKFPVDYKDVLSLKGVGEYTAAAICSFAYNKTHAVVDGNVYRVLSRVFGISTPIDSTQGKKEFKQIADLLINPKDPGRHNQSIMEFGALQCIPVKPDCDNCVLNNSCVAYSSETIIDLPVKSKKIKQRNRYFNYFYIQHNNNTYFQQRTANDVWKGLYEFPLIETEKDVSFEELIKTEKYKTMIKDIDSIEINSDYFNLKHVLSHQKIFAKFYSIKIETSNKNTLSYVLTSFNSIRKLPVSRLTEIFLETLK